MNDLPTTPKTGFRVLLTRPRPPAGTSLLLTLVVLSAIVVLLVMMSRLVTVERRVTQGYSDILRAEMAAQAGTAEATSILVELFSKHPDSVTFWDPNMGGTTTPGTVFMYRDMPPDQEHPGSATTSTPPNIYAIPLISGSSVRQYYPTNDYAATLPAAATANPPAGVAKTYVDINEPNAFGTRTSTGWIGALPGKTTLPGEIRVPWMKVLKDPTAPEDHNVAPTTRLKKNPPVIRYAWWIEDESFKVNVNTAKGSGRGPLLAEVDPSGYLKPKPSLQGLFSNAVAEQLSLARTNMLGTDGRMLSVFQLGHSKSLPEGFTTAQEFGDTYKFLLTTESSGLDLTRAGALRFNLNEAVERTYSNVAKDVSGHPDLSIASVDVPGNTKRTIGQIAAAISRNSPRFGQRFYRNNSTVPTPSNYAGNPKRDAANMVKFTAQDPHQDLYVQKLAANIFDYGSPTRNPTVINNAGVVSAGKPVFTLTDLDYQMDGIPKNPYPNPVWAIGKKAIPYLTEYVMHARHVTSEPSAGLAAQYPGVIRQFKIDIDHYFEFWNMSTEDIRPNLGDLGPDPVLVMENQPAISATGDADPAKMPNYPTGADVPAGRAFEIKLDRGFRKRGSNTSEKIVFEAGKLTIITTDPDWETHAVNLKIPADTAVYVAEELYAPGSGTRCDQGISLPPHVQEAWSGDVPNRVTSTVQNVRSYIMPCFNKDADDNRPEVQMGRDDDREDNRVAEKPNC
ncbi:hypothetical protein [Verrucomicrobium spinosum]|uniref:hypothetical protein n=1 Tax=Verrucomicrobium spinosum TaxID=2736 RepID=UPI00094646B2|nr:hypothetical protein [Verrucomicrobium spinosum]